MSTTPLPPCPHLSAFELPLPPSLCADVLYGWPHNTQLYDHLRVNTIERSEACLQDIVQCRLKLNPSKTELIWFWLDRGHSIEKFQQQPLIRLNSQKLVNGSSSVRDLGVIIGSGLTLTSHDSILAKTCFYQLQRIRQAKKNLDEDFIKASVRALVLSRLDYTATRYWPTCQK